MKSDKGIVVVFDEFGEQMPAYQGQYGDVRERILRDAPPDAVFSHVSNSIEAVSGENW